MRCDYLQARYEHSLCFPPSALSGLKQSLNSFSESGGNCEEGNVNLINFIKCVFTVDHS